MSGGFEPVYRSTDGQAVQLEAARRRAATGEGYLHHRLVVADGRPGAVVIAEAHERLLLVRSERDALGATLWEFPRGTGEPDETEIETAMRELLEETGITGHDPRALGAYATDSSVFPQTVAVILCEVDPDAPRTAPDGEVHGERWVALLDMPGLVTDGTIRDAHTLAAFALYFSAKGTS